MINKAKIRKIVRNVIKEAAKDEFSLETLSSICSFRDKLNYCKEMLGPKVGKGSSRIVFQIDDEKVLKLAFNKKGLEQNKYEGQDDYMKNSYSIFPEVFDKSEDGSWVVSEFVLPASAKDFKECLGISFDDWCGVLNWFQIWYRRPTTYRIHPSVSEEFAENMVLRNEMASEYSSFVSNYSDFSIEDLYNLENYGLALREGEPYIVILDSGLNEKIFVNFYKRR